MKYRNLKKCSNLDNLESLIEAIILKRMDEFNKKPSHPIYVTKEGMATIFGFKTHYIDQVFKRLIIKGLLFTKNPNHTTNANYDYWRESRWYIRLDKNHKTEESYSLKFKKDLDEYHTKARCY